MTAGHRPKDFNIKHRQVWALEWCQLAACVSDDCCAHGLSGQRLAADVVVVVVEFLVFDFLSFLTMRLFQFVCVLRFSVGFDCL